MANISQETVTICIQNLKTKRITKREVPASWGYEVGKRISNFEVVIAVVGPAHLVFGGKPKPEESGFVCPNCGEDGGQPVDYDFGIERETGYHDAGTRCTICMPEVRR